MVSLMVIRQNVSFFVYMYIDLMNLKPINYLKIVMPTSPGFFFKSDRLLKSKKEVVCKDKIFFFATRLLTLYCIIHGLTAEFQQLWRKELLKTLWEKEKMLVTSIFFFLPQCCLPFLKQVSNFEPIHQSVFCKCFQFGPVENFVVR